MPTPHKACVSAAHFQRHCPRFKGTRHMIQLNNISGQVHDGLCSTTCMLAWLTISCSLLCCDLPFNSCNFSIFKAKCPAFCSWEKKNGFERLNSMRKEFEFILVFLSIFFFVTERCLFCHGMRSAREQLPFPRIDLFLMETEARLTWYRTNF